MKTMEFADGEIVRVMVGDVIPHPLNPRRAVMGRELDELAASIKALGQLQPGVARPHPDLPGKLQLLAGHRRLSAITQAGLGEILVLVRHLADRPALEVMVTENLHRADLTPLEEAAGVATLLSIGKDVRLVADDLGKSVSWVSRRARLNELHPDLRVMVNDAEHWMSRLHIAMLELMASFPVEVQEGWLSDEGSPWRQFRKDYEGDDWIVENYILQGTRELKRAPWKLADADLLPSAGPCATCVKRSGCQPDLFGEQGELGKKDTCLDAACWKRKADNFLALRVAATVAKHPNALRVAEAGAGASTDGVLGPWQYEVVKKSDKGAVPAVVVNGPGLGKLLWVIPDRGAETAAAGASVEAGTKVKTLKDKRRELDSKRIAWAMGQVSEALGRRQPPPLADLLALLAVYGTREKREHWSSHLQPELGDKVWMAGHAFISGAQSLVRGRLWDLVLPVMRKRLEVLKVTDVPTDQEKEAEWLCGFAAGPDWTSLVASSGEAIPEPKSWAKQEAEEDLKGKQAAGKKGKLTDADLEDIAGEMQADADKVNGRPKRRPGKKRDEYAGGWEPDEWSAMNDSGIGEQGWKELTRTERNERLARWKKENAGKNEGGGS